MSKHTLSVLVENKPGVLARIASQQDANLNQVSYKTTYCYYKPTFWGQLKETFFFSTQTFVTVGYGRINPVGDGASLLAALESLTGLLSFAIITGLIYGRFSRPRCTWRSAILRW